VGVPALASFRPQVFATSRRLSPPLLRGLVSSRYHVQGFVRSGVCPRLAGAAAHRRDLAPLPFKLARSPGLAPSFLTEQFLAATFEPVDFEALLRDPMRTVNQLLKPAPDRSPLRFLLLQVLRDTTVNPVPRAIRS